jgi:hypothetical protein
MSNVLNSFFSQSTAEEYGCFQHGNVTTQTVDRSMTAVLKVFQNRIINTGVWPFRFPDGSYRDFISEGV